MKKKYLWRMVCAGILLFTGCSVNQKKEIQDDRLSVYASFYPMADFAEKIGGDHVKVVNMTPAGVEPHDYEPSMEDVKGLSKADVFIYNGDDMEHWANRVLHGIDNPNLKVVKASEALSLKEENRNTDPHTWLSIRNAIQEMATIKEAFSTADPDHKKDYEANYNQYKELLVKLDKKYRDELAPYKGKSVVVAHQAFGYLFDDYGLKQLPIDGLTPDSEPTAAKVKQIMEEVKKNNVRVIYYEELVDPKVASMIAQETGAKTAVLNTLEGLSNEDLKNGRDYLSVMEDNLTALLSAWR